MTALQLIGRGETDLRNALAAFFSTEIPRLISLALVDWNLPANLLPVPAEYNAYDPLQAKQYPAIGFVFSNDRNHIRIDQLDADQMEYNVIYQVRTYVVARTPQNADGTWYSDGVSTPPGRNEAIRARADLIRLVQWAYINTPSCNDPRIRFREETMTTDIMEPFQPNTQAAGRWLAGAIITAEIEFKQFSPPSYYGNPANQITTPLQVQPLT